MKSCAEGFELPLEDTLLNRPGQFAAANRVFGYDRCRDDSIRLDRPPDFDGSFQPRVRFEFPLIVTVQCGLIAPDDLLYFVVRSGTI